MPADCRLPAAGVGRGGGGGSYLPEYAKPGSKVVEGLSYLPEYANPGSKVVEGRSYLLEYAKPGSKAAAERSGSGVAACVRTALGEYGELRR